jgi:ubiquinone biosynthesis protein
MARSIILSMFRRIPTIGRTYRHIARYGEIIAVFVKYGLEDLLASIRVERLLPRGMRRLPRPDASVRALAHGERIRMAFTELGPTFIKLGQFMSNRPDVLPPEIIAALRGLQDSVRPFDQEESIAIIEKELRKPVTGLFAEFSHEPVASASVSQVHRAKLADGTLVAVKVQRPGLEKIIDADIDILYQAASLIERHVPGAKYFDPLHICEEFERSLRKEIDFRNEASHIERFAANFSGDATIKVPALYREFTTKRVITTEYIEGVKASDPDKIRAAGLDPHLIAQQGTVLLLKQVFEHGFFHADPHPGNILVLPGNVICFLDFGIMGILSPTLKEYMVSLMLGVVNKDPQKIVRTLVESSQQSVYDMHGLEYDVSELLEEYIMLSLRDMNVNELIRRLNRIIVKHQIKILPGFYLLFKAMVTIEGVGYSLDPDFNLVRHLEPFARKIISERLNPIKFASDVLYSGRGLGHILRDMPYDVKDIMSLVKAGRMRIEFEHRGLEPMLRTHDRLVNRIVFALILASLIVGSSLVVLSRIPPTFHGVPVIGVFGFIAAGLIGLWLLASILIGKKM